MVQNSLTWTRHRCCPPTSPSATLSKYICIGICNVVFCLPLSTFPSLSLCLCLRVNAILEDVQVIGGRDSNDVLRRMPGHMQYFLSEVQAIDAHVSTATLTASIHATGPQHSPRLAALPPGFQGDASPSLPIKHPEEAVVRPCHDHADETETRDTDYNEGIERNREKDEN